QRQEGLKTTTDIPVNEGIRSIAKFKYHIESDTRLLIAMKLPRRKFLHLAAIPDSLIRLSLQCAALPKEKTAQRGATSHAAPPNRGSSSNSHLRGTRMPVEEPSTAENSENSGPET